MAWNKGQGKSIKWVREAANYAGDDCLIVPFSRNPETGYAMFRYLGKMHYVHRFVCELAHGPAPSPKHYATHSCGNGHGGCANPRHLAWDTSAGNADDRVFHGRNNGGGRTKLTQEIADKIRALKGQESQYEIARKFCISRENVARIHRGVAWNGKTRGGWDMRFTAEQRALMAMKARQLHKEGKTYDEIGAQFGVSRTYASGLARGKYR